MLEARGKALSNHVRSDDKHNPRDKANPDKRDIQDDFDFCEGIVDRRKKRGCLVNILVTIIGTVIAGVIVEERHSLFSAFGKVFHALFTSF